MCTCIQSFDSVASHLELVILSGKFRITEHAHEHEMLLQELHFHQVMGIMLHKQVIH